MKTTTKLFGLGALGALGAGVYAIARAAKQRTALRDQRDLVDSFDYGDLDEPVVISEEVIVVTEAGPYEIDMELVPASELASEQQGEQQTGEQPGEGQPSVQAQQPVQGSQGEQPFDMPGRGAGPR